MVAQATIPAGYDLRTVPLIRQRGGITTAYIIFDANNQFVKSFHTKPAALRFCRSLQAATRPASTSGADHA